jgi:hypothetical protein
MVLIDISCPCGRIFYGANTLRKVYIDKKEKYSSLTEETSNIRKMHVEKIPIIISSLGGVHARSPEALRNLVLCDDKEIKKIGRPRSEAAIARSMEIWRNMQKTSHM